MTRVVWYMYIENAGVQQFCTATRCFAALIPADDAVKLPPPDSEVYFIKRPLYVPEYSLSSMSYPSFFFFFFFFFLNQINFISLSPFTWQHEAKHMVHYRLRRECLTVNCIRLLGGVAGCHSATTMCICEGDSIYCWPFSRHNGLFI